MTEYTEYKYSISDHSHPELAQCLLKLTADLGASLKICELGSGSGWLSHELAKRGNNVLGVDRSESGVKTAQQAALSKNVEYAVENIDDALAVRMGRQNAFDVVISNDVIEHLYDPSQLVLCAKQLLKPAGKLLLATPYHGYLKNLAIALAGKADQHYDPLWVGGHIKFFSPKTIEFLLRDCGFEVDKFEYWGRAPGLWKSMMVIASLKP